MIYDPVAYWQERGLTYEAKFREERYAEQERALTTLLHTLPFDSVLEVGCGFGRIGDLIHRLRPSVEYTGIDLSPDMLAAAKERVPTGTFHESALADFKPGRKHDLVIAVEVLMHVPPDDLPAALRAIDRLSARHIVTVDWTTPLTRRKVASHNFLHDYGGLAKGPFGRVREVRQLAVGLQTIHVVSK